ncbi:hypothetical protein [Bdellovibrio sp. HCB209]|uniref:hypothetical protein n=1 Tax=Bdellovibrio sp. HCB209 TaxID=3394354 RepID=UPI0039B5697B
MRKLALSALASVLSFSALSFAVPMDGDLVLEYKHYYSEFDKYVCKNTSEKALSTVPQEIKDLYLSFEDLNVSIFLDQALLTADFKDGDTECRYSVLYAIDKNAKTLTASETKAFAIDSDKSCDAGKGKVDLLLKKLDYVVLHDHLTLKLPTQSLKEACGADSDSAILAFKRIHRK